jgi:hypothetical protein
MPTPSNHSDIEEKHCAKMNELAMLLNAQFKGFGFALLVFDFDTPGRMNYISNAQRSDMVNALKELIAKFESETHGKAHSS